MNSIFAEKQKIYYFDSKEKQSVYDFCKTLSCFISEKVKEECDIVLLCIGSDRATGDCLGPIIGYKLSKYTHIDVSIYGTLEHPVHAKNLEETLIEINTIHKDPFVIAIDASLGSTKHLGYITLGEGSLRPGIGVNKDLPNAGDIFITGIVNISGMLNHMLLQTTRLDVVMKLADFICFGLRYSLHVAKR